MNIDQVGQAFVNHYYSLFDTNRSALQPLYKPQSMLSFEGEKFQGDANIIGKLNSLAFSRVQHLVKSLDCHPSGADTVIVVVCGDLCVDNNPNPLKFSQTFHLIPDKQTNGYWVHNDIFRLNYG